MDPSFTRTQRGFGYLWLLFALVVVGVGLAVVGQVWHTAAQREKEADLLYVGQEYRKAIKAYHDKAPTGVKEYPRTLEDLLRDKRVPFVARYLRRLPRDPITQSEEWGLVRQGDRIIGVYSLSNAEPRKKAGFPKKLKFDDKSHYSDWKFVVSDDDEDSKTDASGAGKAGAGR